MNGDDVDPTQTTVVTPFFETRLERGKGSFDTDDGY
jgi:hypothetical protein